MSFGRRQNWSMHKCFGASSLTKMTPPGMSNPPSNKFGWMVRALAQRWIVRLITRMNWEGLEGVSLHPLLYHRSKFLHQSTNGATNQITFAPQCRSWASLEQWLEASCSLSYELRFNLRVNETNSPTGRSTRMVQECILVEAGQKEEAASCLVTDRHQSYLS